MSKFFNEIVAPQLTQTDYGLGIESMVNNINSNFQKVFTLPFLKGDDGDRLTTRFCPFWDETAKLTEEGYKIFKTIFVDEKIKNGITFENIEPGCTLGDLMAELDKGNLFNDSENSSRTQFEETYGPAGNPKILLYYQIDTESNEETLLGAAQLYYFFDPRVQGLSDFIGSNNTESVEGFVDYTCILSTKYVNGDLEYSYVYEKQSGWPTLYFDSSSKQFCWQINGQKTGVNAQGVNGRDGRGSKIWLCVVKPTATTEAGQTMSTNVDYSKGKYTKFEITDIWVPKVNEWLNINEGESYKKALNALGESGMPSSGDLFIAYLYSAGDQSIEVPVYTIVGGEWVKSNETEVFNKPPMSIYGTLFYDAQANNDKKYYVFSNISQNLYRTTDNTVLVDMLNHIGDYTGDNSSASNGVQDPMCITKGLFVPLRDKETDSDTHKFVHVLYNDRDNGSLNLKVDALANVVDVHESQTDVNVDKEKKNLNIIYNTKVDGTLNVTESTTLVGKKNPGAVGADNLVDNLSDFPLVIDTQGEDNKLIIGPRDLYAIDKNGNSKTFCINQKSGAEVIIGNNVLTVKDKEVYISQEAHKSPETKGKYGTSFEGDITLYASYKNGNLAFNVPLLVVKTSSQCDGNYDEIHNLFKPGVGDSPFEIKRGLTVNGATTLNGSADLKSTLSVTGATTLSSKLSVTGATTLNGSADLKSTLSVTGDTTLNGSADLKSTLSVTGDTTLSSKLSVTGDTTLNSDLILNSRSLSGSYYSNKIKFLRGTSSDNINDWYMYGNTSGLLEIGCNLSDSGEEPLLKLGRSDNGTKSMEVNASVTAKVNNVENISLGVPVGSIMMWPIAAVPIGWMSMSGSYALETDNTSYKQGTQSSSSKNFTALNGKTMSIKIAEANDGNLLINYIGEGVSGNNNYYKVNSSTSIVKLLRGLNGGGTALSLSIFDYLFQFIEFKNNGSVVLISNHTFGFKMAGRFPLVDSDWKYGSIKSRSLGEMDGEETHTLTNNEMPLHSHAMLGYTKYDGFGTTHVAFGDPNYNNGSSNSLYTGNTGGGQAHNNMPPYHNTHFIIKYQ